MSASISSEGSSVIVGVEALMAAALPEDVAGVVLDTRLQGASAHYSSLPSVDSESLSVALSNSYGFLEASGGRLLAGGNLRNILSKSGLYLVVRTVTAYSVEVAHLFCRGLAQRLSLADEFRDNIELALHEALINGLIHGNLEISSTDRHSLARFAEYCETVETRLADRQLGGRPIEVSAIWCQKHVEISVVDCGPGYDHAQLIHSDDVERKSGRGLQLIQTLAHDVEIGDGGRRLTMRFLR